MERVEQVLPNGTRVRLHGEETGAHMCIGRTRLVDVQQGSALYRVDLDRGQGDYYDALRFTLALPYQIEVIED